MQTESTAQTSRHAAETAAHAPHGAHHSAESPSTASPTPRGKAEPFPPVVPVPPLTGQASPTPTTGRPPHHPVAPVSAVPTIPTGKPHHPAPAVPAPAPAVAHAGHAPHAETAPAHHGDAHAATAHASHPAAHATADHHADMHTATAPRPPVTPPESQGQAATHHSVPHPTHPTTMSKPEHKATVVLPGAEKAAEEHLGGALYTELVKTKDGATLAEGLRLDIQNAGHGLSVSFFRNAGEKKADLPLLSSNADVLRQALTAVLHAQPAIAGGFKLNAHDIKTDIAPYGADDRVAFTLPYQHDMSFQHFVGRYNAAFLPPAPKPLPANVVESIMHQGVANDTQALGIAG